MNLSYNPVVGAAGHAVAVMLGANPKKQLADDLLLMKCLLELDNPAEIATASRAARQVDADNTSR